MRGSQWLAGGVFLVEDWLTAPPPLNDGVELVGRRADAEALELNLVVAEVPLQANDPTSGTGGQGEQ
jgi:hypothetical protein